MNDWQPIETAPRDDTCIQVKIPSHGSDCVVVWMAGLLDENNLDCSGWCWMSESEPPDSWTDGICWAVNEDNEPSIEPTHWMPLPAPPFPVLAVMEKDK